MAAHKGHKKLGGRTKGTPNKKTELLLDKCNELDVDPFEILLLFAKGDWKALGYDGAQKVINVTKNGDEILGDVISPEIRSRCAKEACEYIHPKRKAVELSNDSEKGFVIVVKDYESIK